MVIVLAYNYNKSNIHITFCLNCVTLVQKYHTTRECTSNLLVHVSIVRKLRLYRLYICITTDLVNITGDTN